MALNENCRTYPPPKEGQNNFPDVVELNVGGQLYSTRRATLITISNSLLGRIFSSKTDLTSALPRDPKGRYFIDRDGFLFRYVLDYLRDKQVVLPDHFPERERLKREAEYFQLPEFVRILTPDDLKQSPDDNSHSDFEDASHGRICPSSSFVSDDRKYGFITVGYRGSSCTTGREFQAEAKFRRVSRILICGRISLVTEVFEGTLNESRDTDRPYTSRFYLKFKHLERAFDMLAECGFHMVACNSAVTASLVSHCTDGNILSSYTEYVFFRGPSQSSSTLHFDCCCKSHGGDLQEESGTSFNELSTSCSESQSESSSPHSTGLSSPVKRRANLQTLDRPPKKGTVQMLQQSELHRLRTLTGSSGDTTAYRKKLAPERMSIEEELEKCIRDFRRIKIPDQFPERKYVWQSELLRKYHL
ncbi:BTB/POZ domain-containing protein KCTD16-like [Anguilla anguilla]|uniref:BTB/POZ domain-containing protein KCTD16-like n=1 Tax=Anguilla anguilla TaxID=7936 RepID=UPI0015B0DED4|nr:BTB/POZ domain-containing protein KCTD16-like [Anguilla anguilla]